MAERQIHQDELDKVKGDAIQAQIKFANVQRTLLASVDHIDKLRQQVEDLHEINYRLQRENEVLRRAMESVGQLCAGKDENK